MPGLARYSRPFITPSYGYYNCDCEPVNGYEIKEEFGLSELAHYPLTGNYRSTQRIIDFSSHFQDGGSKITSLARHASESGTITFSNRNIHLDNLPAAIAALINRHLAAGVKDHEICVLAPTWRLVVGLGRRLLAHLSDVNLDAPGLSPLRYQADSVWFKLARLFLTDADPSRYRTRLRWADDFVRTIEQELGQELNEHVRSARNILRYRNAITSNETDGVAYLADVFCKFLSALEINLADNPALQQSYDNFFAGARSRLEESDYDVPCDVLSLKRMFRHPAGVVVNTCHGVKGEEYTVVIVLVRFAATFRIGVE